MRNAVTGALVALWVYADTHIRAGDELPVSQFAIDRMVGIEGFCDLIGEAWIRVKDDGATVILPGYCEKNGLLSKEKRKASNADRQRRFREKHNAVSNASSNAVTSNAVTPLDQDQDQDLKNKDKEVALRLPEWLPSEEWKAWLEVRKKNKAPNTPRALHLAIGELTRLKSLGFDPAKVLDQSTLKGWKSLHPVKPELAAVTTEPKSQLCDYCTKAASGTVNGRRSCDEHFDRAMANERPAKVAA